MSPELRLEIDTARANKTPERLIDLIWLHYFPKGWHSSWLSLYHFNPLVFIFVWLGDIEVDRLALTTRYAKRKQ